MNPERQHERNDAMFDALADICERSLQGPGDRVMDMQLSGDDLCSLSRLQSGGGCVASRDPERACAEYSRLWDLGFVDDLGTVQAITDAGREALRVAREPE